MDWINTIIAAFVAAIVFQQWRTARHRIILDLFERRMAMIDKINSVVAEILGGGQATNEINNRFQDAIRGNEFLFQSNVTDYLDKTHKLLLNLHFWDIELDKRTGSKMAEAEEKRQEIWDQIKNFHSEFSNLVMPYVQMHQKLFWI